MRSLSWKLAGALLLIVILAVGLMAYLANVNANRQLTEYITMGNQSSMMNISTSLGSYYARQGNWNNVQPIMDGYLRNANDRLVLADASGKIVADTENMLAGSTAASAGLSSGTVIYANGINVGQIYQTTIHGNSNNNGKRNANGKGNSNANDNGMGGMMGQSGGSMTTVVTTTTATLEQDFTSRFNRSLVITAVIVAVVALLVGLLLTRQITRPLKALVNGVGQIARGNLKHRVNIKSRDELNELGQSFNAMADSLDKAEEERKRIIADIAHDLRTPLTIIEGTVTGIEDGVFQPDKEHLDAIKDQTALLTRLTADLRVLSLAESGQLKLALAPVDITDLLRSKTAQYEVRAREKKLELKTSLPANLPTVNADASRLEQVLGNLVSNAIMYTPAGGSITVSAKTVPQDAAHKIDKPSVIVSVSDTGEGIAPEHLPHLFERFYRIDKARTRNEGGSGLGLAIVKQLVQAHGGRVWAESALGMGSTFYFSLPL